MLTLRQLIEKYHEGFHVPAYQRRYVWGQIRPGEKDSAAFLMDCLLQSYQQGEDYFLQSLTFSPLSESKASVVDGQQRLTFLALLLGALGDHSLHLTYESRKDSEEFFKSCRTNIPAKSQDIYFFKKTLNTIAKALADVDTDAFKSYLLDHVSVMLIEIEDQKMAIPTYKMMNGSKSLMMPQDIIKADIMRLASDIQQQQESHETDTMRSSYAQEWENWVRWWSRPDVAKYYQASNAAPMELTLKLCLRDLDANFSMPLTYEEFRSKVTGSHASKQFFYKLRCTQRRIQEAYDDPRSYNRVQAIMLLQNEKHRYNFLWHRFVEMDVDESLEIEFYKLSFLGMTTEEILRGDSPAQRFDEHLAAVGMSDVYHTSSKAEVFKLLLRLNIDEDIKLKRRFDFDVWSNRSLEHIYSKSKVWHKGTDGRVLDGNDNDLRMTERQVNNDPTFLHRREIVNHDGMPLSEHCIGNLVLLYGDNNAAFGNATFEEKKVMFLTPGDQGVFRSRNLLHSVCVFAGKEWTQRSIVDNYNLTLKNLKLYYGYK